MMIRGRRKFLKQMGLGLAAAASPGSVMRGGEGIPPADGFGLEPFVELHGVGRISGRQAIADHGLKLAIDEGSYPSGKRYMVSITNSSSTLQLLEKVGFTLAPGRAKQSDRWRVFLDSGNAAWCGVKRLDALGTNENLPAPIRQRQPNGGELVFHRSDLQTVVWDAAGGDALLLGFLRQRYGYDKIDIIPNHDARAIDRFEAWQEFGFEFPAGREQMLDPLVIAEGHDPLALLEGFGSAVREHQGRKFDGPPIVGMDTWYGYRDAITEEIVLANARIIGELFGGYPQKMQNLMICDHGWQQDANWGYWEPDNERFPHGMKWLSEQLAQEGVDLGLWTTAFSFTENAPNYKDLVPLEALDQQGVPMKEGPSVWNALPTDPESGIRVNYLFDSAKDAVQQMWLKNYAEMKNWGVVFWMLDFFSLTTSASNWSKTSMGDLFARTWKTFRSAVGDKCKFQTIDGTNIQIGYNDAVQTGGDIGDAGTWPGAMQNYRYGLASMIGTWYKNRRFWVNNPDAILFAKGCSLNEARVRATAVAMSGGMFQLSEDLREVSEERLEIIRRLIPPYPEAARPLDLFENPFPEGYPTFWAQSLQTGFGPTTALAVFNLTSKTRQYEITPGMLGIASGREFIALEWWQYQWLGRFKGKFMIEVPAEDVAVIHAQPTGEVPSLVSVSHHVTGGYIVENVTFDQQTSMLTGVLVTKPGLRVLLFGHKPAGWGFAREGKFHGSMSSLGGWQYEVVTKATHTPFKVPFAGRKRRAQP